MCGLVTKIYLGEGDIQITKDIERMLSSLKHRGPDDEGYTVVNSHNKITHLCGDDTTPDLKEARRHIQEYNISGEQGKICFGHRRLSILDLSSSGHQPMTYQNERYVISFNGEIYNYLEIKKELKQSGYIFESDTDTEVILASYDLWGYECSSRFNGDWALVIYDRVENEVFISRDRFGIKPLYYIITNDVLMLASEYKALLQSSDTRAMVNIDFLNSYLIKGAAEWEEQTAIEGVLSFPPAHHCLIKLNMNTSEFAPQRYWQLKVNRSSEKFDTAKCAEYANEFYHLLEDAVKIRLRSDVKIGCALSGGFDSSSIAYLANELDKSKDAAAGIECFSLTYGEDHEDDESFYIDIVCKQLGVISHRALPDATNIENLVNEVTVYSENPPDGLGTSGYFTTKLAHQNDFKVTLDGQGADEQLAGYFRYIATYLNDLTWISRLYQSIQLYLRLRGSGISFKWLMWGYLPKVLQNMYLKFSNRTQPLKEGQTLNDLLKHSVEHGLTNLLKYGDRRSMAFSIESRMPYMDHRLVEFNASVPGVYKIHNGWTKYYARIAFADKLDPRVVWRKDKRGWPSPDILWINSFMYQFAKDRVSKSQILHALKLNKMPTRGKVLKADIRKVMVSLFEEKFLGKYGL